jgi:hypothetical protein
MRLCASMNIDQQGLHELMLLSLEQIDTAFNIWMSATPAEYTRAQVWCP